MKKMSALVLCTMLGACAGAPSGGEETVKFISSPEGATVTTTTGVSCVTPCQARIRRVESFTATFTKAGFSTASVDVGTKVQDYNKGYDLGPVSIGFSSPSVPGDDRGVYNTVHVPNPVSVELVAK